MSFPLTTSGEIMFKKLFPICAILNENAAAGGSSLSPNGTAGTAGRKRNVFEVAASGADKAFDRLMEASDAFDAGEQTPGDAVRLQAAAQQLAFISTATATTVNSYGDSLETLAKKQ
jgi:hypothetical protein